MKIRVLSDLHFEFHHDWGKSFLEKLPDVECDVVAIAGDLCDAKILRQSLNAVCGRFSDKPVLYVPGNHEYYGSTPMAVKETLHLAVAALPNLRWLDNDSCTIDGQLFFGGTMWYRRLTAKQMPLRYNMNDYLQIAGFEPWVHEQNDEFIEAVSAVSPGAVVISHHLPGPFAVHPRYKYDPLNPFFVCDMSEQIDKLAPALWIFGHTHESCDTKFLDTRVVCNPYGYSGVETNYKFKPDLVVEI